MRRWGSQNNDHQSVRSAAGMMRFSGPTRTLVLHWFPWPNANGTCSLDLGSLQKTSTCLWCLNILLDVLGLPKEEKKADIRTRNNTQTRRRDFTSPPLNRRRPGVRRKDVDSFRHFFKTRQNFEIQEMCSKWSKSLAWVKPQTWSQASNQNPIKCKSWRSSWGLSTRPCSTLSPYLIDI